MMDDKAAAAGADVMARLRRAAEMEMRRVLDDSRPRKRPRSQSGGEGEPFVPVDRFRYAVVQELEAGAKGFIVTCNFRREKSATREASQLLRRYMPAHLFPPPPPPAARSQGKQPEPAADASALEQRKGEDAAEQGPAVGGPVVGAAAEASTEATEATAVLAVDNTKQRLSVAAPTVDGDGGDDDSDGSSSEGDDEEGDGGRRGARGGAEEPEKCGGPGGEPSALGLAKVGCRGVVVIRLSAAAAAVVDPVGVVEALLADLEARTLQPPRHCQRIIPMDATCVLTSAGLTAAVAAAAAAYRRRQPKPGDVGGGSDGAGVEPFSYAIAYRNRATEIPPAAAVSAPGAAVAPAATVGGAVEGSRGAEEAAAQQDRRQGSGHQEGCAGGAGSAVLSDRGRIISVVAGSVAEAFGEAAKVNLKKPQVAVLVETMPVGGRQFAGVAILPQHMFVARGRLVVKPLVKNAPA